MERKGENEIRERYTGSLNFFCNVLFIKETKQNPKCIYMTKYYNFTNLRFGTWVLFILRIQIFCRPETYYNFKKLSRPWRLIKHTGGKGEGRIQHDSQGSALDDGVVPFVKIGTVGELPSLSNHLVI